MFFFEFKNNIIEVKHNLNDKKNGLKLKKGMKKGKQKSWMEDGIWEIN